MTIESKFSLGLSKSCGIRPSSAEKIGAVGLLVAAISGNRAGLASVISLAKLQNALASIGKISEETDLLCITIVISLVIYAVAAVIAFCGLSNWHSARFASGGQYPTSNLPRLTIMGEIIHSDAVARFRL